MKKIVPLSAAVCILASFICAIIMLQTDWEFSELFKTMLLFVSASIGLIAFWKGRYQWHHLAIAVISFCALAFILWNSDQYAKFWNYVLSLHIVLIGIALFYEAKYITSTVLRKITRFSVVATMSVFILIVSMEIHQEWLISTTFVMTFITAILLIVGKFIPPKKQ